MVKSGQQKLRNLEIIGTLLIFLSGILLHFLYDITQKSVVGILFGCVNESIWEHSKVFALALCVWTIIELACSVPYFRQFIVAKVFSLYLQCTVIITGIFLYQNITEKIIPLSKVGIISFFAVVISQFTAYKFTISEKDIRELFPLALGFLFLFFIIFFCFSVVPPHMVVFKDPLTQIYGIIPKNIDVGAYFMNNTEV